MIDEEPRFVIAVSNFITLVDNSVLNKATHMCNGVTLVSDKKAIFIISIGNFTTPVGNSDALRNNSDPQRINFGER